MIPIMSGSGWGQKVRKRSNGEKYSISHSHFCLLWHGQDCRWSKSQGHRPTFKCISQKDQLVTFPGLSAPSNSSDIGARSGAYSFVNLNHHLEMEDMLLVCPLSLLRVEQLCPCYSLIVTSGYPKRIVNTTLVWADQWLLDSMASSTL